MGNKEEGWQVVQLRSEVADVKVAALEVVFSVQDLQREYGHFREMHWLKRRPGGGWDVFLFVRDYNIPRRHWVSWCESHSLMFVEVWSMSDLINEVMKSAEA